MKEVSPEAGGFPGEAFNCEHLREHMQMPEIPTIRWSQLSHPFRGAAVRCSAVEPETMLRLKHWEGIAFQPNPTASKKEGKLCLQTRSVAGTAVEFLGCVLVVLILERRGGELPNEVTNLPWQQTEDR